MHDSVLMKQSKLCSHTKSILVVDDNEAILQLLSKGLKIYGMQVFIAENSLEAWDLFNSKEIDIVLTDIYMPGLNDTELSSRIRNHSPHVIIAVMTGGDADIGKSFLHDGIADYFFTKPFAISSVCKTLSIEAQSTSSIIFQRI